MLPFSMVQTQAAKLHEPTEKMKSKRYTNEALAVERKSRYLQQQ